MSVRKISFAPDEYYHIYNRGNSKQKIFRNRDDYARFIKLLYLANSNNNFEFRKIRDVYETNRDKRLISIGAYCLMPNHFHLAIKDLGNEGITKFMHKLMTSYSMYYNLISGRTGALFEGKFKSEHLGNDQYLKYIFSYIHLNPIKIIDSKWKERGTSNSIKNLNFLKSYQFSSYLDYIAGNRKESAIINPEDFPEYFPTKESFENDILDWITYGEAEALPPLF